MTERTDDEWWHSLHPDRKASIRRWLTDRRDVPTHVAAARDEAQLSIEDVLP